MNRHQTTVSKRVSESLDRIRTELDTIRTKEIARVISSQYQAVTKLAETSDKLADAVQHMEKNLSLQTHLLKSAEALILIGSTYYLYSLISHLDHPADLIAIFDKMTSSGLTSSLGPVALVFIASIIFMNIWPKAGAKSSAIIGRGRCALNAIRKKADR